jgi:hypothetical protein
MWNKIKGYVAVFVAGVIAVLGVFAAIMESRKKGTAGADSRSEQRERKIDVLIDGQGSAIARERSAIESNLDRVERIENIAGSSEVREREQRERERELVDIVERRKRLNDRVKKILGEYENGSADSVE